MFLNSRIANRESKNKQTNPLFKNKWYYQINNRYISRFDWRKLIAPYISKFRWVIGSDAHQPHWLNQNYARQVAKEMGIKETILF